MAKKKRKGGKPYKKIVRKILRFLACRDRPEGWDDEKEAEYQKWAKTKGDIRGCYK